MRHKIKNVASQNRQNRTQGNRNNSEAGFTLIELLVAVMILPLIIGAIAIALVSVLSLQGGLANRVASAGDAQVVSANFETDIHSALQLTTNSTASCGSGTQLLGLEWNNVNHQLSVYQSVVSYVMISNGSSADSLIRQFCAAGPSATPTSSTTLSYDVSTSQTAAVILPSVSNTAALAGWISTIGITSVSFPITEPSNVKNISSNYAYSLVAVPGASSSSTNLPLVASPTNSCGFATPGTGTYASTLCFVDFSSYNAAQQDLPAGQCTTITTAISGTSDNISFCIAVTEKAPSSQVFPSLTTATGTNSCTSNSGYGPVCPSVIPTYYDPSSSEAFLGNNGFYTGIPGEPALYQTINNSTTLISLTKIQVLDSNGSAVTGWNLITGDAETTDAGEGITWTSDKILNLLPDSPGPTQNAEIGNACPYATAPTGSLFPNTYLTGVGSTTVTCKADNSSNKTGTVMLETTAPTSLTATLVGTGLEAIFIGILLP